LIKVVQLPKIEGALSAWDYKRLAVRFVATQQKYLELAHNGPNSYYFLVVLFPSSILDLGQPFACRVRHMVTNTEIIFYPLSFINNRSFTIHMHTIIIITIIRIIIVYYSIPVQFSPAASPAFPF